MKLLQMFALGTVVATGLVMAQAPTTPTTAQAKTAAKEKMAPMTPQTDAQISDAKAKGQIWCNTTSKACHAADDKLYGKTKRGEFIMPADMDSKGYHMAGAKKAAAAKK